jgi:hypothetical protein
MLTIFRAAFLVRGLDSDVFPRLRQLSASKKEMLGSSLISTLGRLCGDENQAMATLFREGIDDEWRRAALLGTEYVKTSIVREIMPLLRSPHLSVAIRSGLVRWLFGVSTSDS